MIIVKIKNSIILSLLIYLVIGELVLYIKFVRTKYGKKKTLITCKFNWFSLTTVYSYDCEVILMGYIERFIKEKNSKTYKQDLTKCQFLLRSY